MSDEKIGCQAHVEVPAKSYSAQRIRVTSSRQCSWKASVAVGHLMLCATHARLAREGFVSDRGVVLGQNDIREMRKRGDRFYKWARGEE